jgi:hypothetical protein
MLPKEGSFNLPPRSPEEERGVARFAAARADGSVYPTADFTAARAAS